MEGHPSSSSLMKVCTRCVCACTCTSLHAERGTAKHRVTDADVLMMAHAQLSYMQHDVVHTWRAPPKGQGGTCPLESVLVWRSHVPGRMLHATWFSCCMLWTHALRPLRDSGMIALCCSVLHCVAAWCTVLQRCSVVHCVAALQRGVLCCSVAAWCTVLQRVGVVLQRGALCCSVLHCVAAWFTVLQRVAACCTVLQRVALCY